MSSSVTNPTSASKNIPQAAPANYSQAPSVSAFDPSQRRSGSSGSYGAGAATRNTAQARKDQPLRKQGKAQRRARLADEDAYAESAAMKSINSRKGQTSITHLMNFSLPPRPQYQPQHHASNHRHQRYNKTWGLGSGYHAVDKARYVHANYRFIVRPDREYHAQAVDADVYVGWDAVLQVLASPETQAASCPICLSTPVAPRMAKCGHIFCLPCLIRYMHSTDETNPVAEKRARWKKCPICEDSIYISETRPVRWFVGQEASMLRDGGDVLLKLVMREPGTTLALPRDAGDSYGDREDIPWYNVAEIMDYARFMKGGEKYMISQYDDEIEELEKQSQEDELMFGDDTTWSRKAVMAVTTAKESVRGIGDPPDTQNEKKPPPRDPIPFNEEQDVPEMYKHHHAAISVPSIPPTPIAGQSTTFSALDDLTRQTNKISVTLQRKPLPNTTAASRPQTQPYYFYHALPNFYLSALDIRILRATYNHFSSFPSTVLPRITHISTGHIVDDDLRKRAKYIAHLPYGCEVSFLECDWSGIVPAHILDQFTADLGRRNKKNHEKEAREERERVRAERLEDEQRWAAARRRRPSLNNNGIARSLSETDFVPLTAEAAPSSSLPIGEQNSTFHFGSTPPWSSHRQHSSFGPLATPGTSPEAPRTVWGTAAIAPASPQLVADWLPSAPAQDDGWLQGWEKDLLDQPDDNIALVEASINGEGSSSVTAQTGTGKKKQGKKGKKITLMSTNARRGA
jgi:Zinc finger, C3HC4 type (RING finger)